MEIQGFIEHTQLRMLWCYLDNFE